jgi:hypothetical protein
VRPSASSAAGASVEPYIPELPVAAPGSEVGSIGSDHALAGRDADARALVDRARACAGARLENDDDDDRGSWFSKTSAADLPSG